MKISAIIHAWSIKNNWLPFFLFMQNKFLYNFFLYLFLRQDEERKWRTMNWSPTRKRCEWRKAIQIRHWWESINFHSLHAYYNCMLRFLLNNENCYFFIFLYIFYGSILMWGKKWMRKKLFLMCGYLQWAFMLDFVLRG